MQFLGIKLDTWIEFLQKKLEIFWSGFWFIIFVFGAVIFTLPFIYLLSTRFWWVSVAMAIWIYIDRNTCEEGGRPVNWVQNWICWLYVKNYFNGTLVLAKDFELDSTQNYLFCSFPHGVIPMGPFVNIVLRCSKFHQLYPHFIARQSSIKINFFVPILREIILGMKFITCSAKSINFVLNDPNGNNLIILHVGGAEETFYSQPGQYKVVLKKRKGFIKIALQNGTPLVPVITFNENEQFEQLNHSFLRKIQRIVKNHLSFAPIFFNGRGFFQNSFGMFPRKSHLITLLGKPIKINKVENPTDEEINNLHKKFVKELKKLFEENKYKYIINYKTTHLEIL